MDKYYTVEQIAQMLNMHPKTIQRYIREGKLNATKIGKSWRIFKRDLSGFLNNAEASESNNEEHPQSEEHSQNKVLASAVTDIKVRDLKEASEIEKILVAAVNSKPDEYGRSTMHIQYLEYDSTVRIALWGTPRFMEEMFGLIVDIMEQSKE